MKKGVYFTLLFCALLGLLKKDERIQIKRANYLFNYQKKFTQGSKEEQLYLDRSIAFDPNLTSALAEKSVSYLKRGDFSTGFRFLNRAVELDPERHLGYRGFVKLYMLRDYEGAIRDFRELDSLTPNFRDAPWGEDIFKVLGLSYLMQGKYDQAEKEFRKSLDVDEGLDWVESRTILYSGIVALEQSNLEQSIYFFNLTLNFNERYPEAYYYKAKAQFLLGEKIVALKTIDSCADNMEFIERNPYFELPYQVYASDIHKLRERLTSN